MGISTPQEAAIQAASGQWKQLPEVKARQVQIAAILAHEGVTGFTAEGITRALQINLALDEINHLERVVPWMQRTRQWPFT